MAGETIGMEAEDSELGQISDRVGRNLTHESGGGKAEREDEGAIRVADDADPVAGRVGGVPLEAIGVRDLRNECKESLLVLSGFRVDSVTQ